MPLQDYFKHDCDGLTGLELNIGNSLCRSHAVNYPFRIEPHAFEVALVNAVQHAGYRLRYRGMRPRPANGTKTGWT